MSRLLERLEELRAVAERLSLGDAETRKLRGLVVDLIDVVCGREANHIDVNNSGARHAPPDPLTLGATRAAYAPPSPGVQRAIAAPAPDPTVPDPAGADFAAQMERELNEADEKRELKQ